MQIIIPQIVRYEYVCICGGTGWIRKKGWKEEQAACFSCMFPHLKRRHRSNQPRAAWKTGKCYVHACDCSRADHLGLQKEVALGVPAVRVDAQPRRRHSRG